MLAAKLVAMFVLLAAWDRVPTFNIEPACRYLADRVASPEEMKLCLSNEQAAREKLAKEWAAFALEDKDILRRAGDSGRSVLRGFVDLSRAGARGAR